MENRYVIVFVFLLLCMTLLSDLLDTISSLAVQKVEQGREPMHVRIIDESKFQESYDSYCKHKSDIIPHVVSTDFSPMFSKMQESKGNGFFEFNRALSSLL